MNKKFFSSFTALSISLGAMLLVPSVNAKDKNAPKKETHKAGHGAHVHGSAKLSIAIESAKVGTLLLESPGESIIGFEHEANSADEKKAEANALATLEKKASEIFSFNKALGCVVAKTKIEIKKEDHDEHEEKAKGKEDHHHEESGEHTEVEAEYSLKCQKDLAGSALEVNLGKSFPKLKDLDVQILGEKGQSTVELKNAVGSVKL